MNPVSFAPGLMANPFLVAPNFQARGCGCDPGPHYHEYFPTGCQPARTCACEPPRCRREARELLVQAQAASTRLTGNDLATATSAMATMRVTQTGTSAASQGANAPAGTDTAPPASVFTDADPATAATAGAFIGGGCCVYLSIEYMPSNPLGTATGVVIVLVADHDKTIMMWARVVDANAGYHIQEDIITTHPGAKLTVVVLNVTARVRWSETFSC